MYDVDIVVQVSDVMVALRGLDYAISTPGLVHFLGGAPEHLIQERARDRFAMEGDDATGAWEPLRESTLRIREERGFGPGPINMRTGDLYRYVVENVGAVTPTGIGAELRYPGNMPSGTTMYAFATAQQGSQHWGTPARPVAGVGEVDLVGQLALLHGWVVAGVQLIRSAS